jgi:hypothetical protein
MEDIEFFSSKYSWKALKLQNFNFIWHKFWNICVAAFKAYFKACQFSEHLSLSFSQWRMQRQMPTFFSWPLISEHTVDVLTTDSLLTWLLSTLEVSCFGGSLIQSGGDVIVTEGTHSKVSAKQRSTCQSLYFSAPYYHPPRPTYGRMLFNCTFKTK